MVDGVKTRSVSDIMSSPVVSAARDETIAEISARMAKTGVGSVIVTEDDKPVGILTERDLVKVAAAGVDPGSEPVSKWMTPSPDTVRPDLEVTEAFRSLAERGYRHIPVVDDSGKLIGIVSMRDLMKIAQIRPVEGPSGEVPKGLEGVVVAETSIGDVRGMEGFFHYRQYDAVELADKCSLEEVWYLIHEKQLPNRKELAEFSGKVARLRDVTPKTREALPQIASVSGTSRLLDGLRTAYSLMAAELGYAPWLDTDITELREQALKTCAAFPTILVNLYRLARGEGYIEPRQDLPTAVNYLYMLTGKEPDPEEARAIEQYMILTVDHGFNASTFTARVVTSTGADLGSAVVAALCALSGPLHGGAPSRVVDMLDAIGKPENAEKWLRETVSAGKRLMGFGHRVYKTDDPRSVMLRAIAERLGGPNVEFAKYVEKKAVEVLNELKPGRRLYTNVEFYAGVVMDRVGVPREMFTPTFAASRVLGWTEHVIEQAMDNRLIRPAAYYMGPPPPEPVPPIDER
ncbi:MAG: citrate synthase/methylcitrate synthase [Acidimicrobiia bacterium]